MAIETERKFLIRLPDEKILTSQNGIRIRKMVQTYLEYKGKTERRIRKIEENKTISYIYTEKRPIFGSNISRQEDEYEISATEYDKLMHECISELEKVRYSFPFCEHIIEIDVYPYEIGGEALSGKAVLEVELSDADEKFILPEWIDVIKELTGTREFSNKSMAKTKKFK